MAAMLEGSMIQQLDDNHKLVDLRKVQWASLHYANQHGQTSQTNPKTPTVFGEPCSSDQLALHHPLFPGESILERAKRRNMVDTWYPVCRVKLSAGRCLIYTGRRGLSIWEAWKARIFGRK